MLKTRHCPHLLLKAVLRLHAGAARAAQQSIDISYWPGPQQQTRRTLLQRANESYETDRRTPYHVIDPAPYTTRALTIMAPTTA